VVRLDSPPLIHALERSRAGPLHGLVGGRAVLARRFHLLQDPVAQGDLSQKVGLA
jgi:hypothetical protein